jgi:NTE family protein
VFRGDARALAVSVFSLTRDLVLGGLFGRTVTQSLFDASPLRKLIADSLPPGGIAEGIRRGYLYAVAVSATSYHSGRSFTFVQGRPGHPIWAKSRRVVLPVELTADHIWGIGPISRRS